MGALGCGPSKGIKYQKRNTLRVAPVRAGEMMDVWTYYRSGELFLLAWKEGHAELTIKVEEASFAVSVACKPHPNARFKTAYSFVCPQCEKTSRQLFYFRDAVKCRHCHGLYYRTYSYDTCVHLVKRDYDYLRELLSVYERHYAEYEQRASQGMRKPWIRLGTCTRPCRMRKRIERLRHQLKVIEGVLWGNAARMRGVRADAPECGIAA